VSSSDDRPRRAATAVWLSRVASNRPGVVQCVAERFDGLDAALDASLPALRGALASRFGGATRRSGPAAAAVREGGGRAAAQVAREASRFARALAAPLEPPPTSSDEGPSPESRGGPLLVTYEDELYPPRLRGLFDPPPALFVAGGDVPSRLRALGHAPAVAVVGTRAPSAYGREMARLVGGDLARAAVVVVSGVALGIDVCAQLAALEAAVEGEGGFPPSVGVLGCGLDIVHPRSNAAALRALRERGLLISEFWPGTPPSVWRFPARNRVIAGLSQAVVVVEGSRRSGSRITAELAVDASREVLAVPGEAGRRLSEAPHHLIRHGAHLCESADDVLAVLGLERTYGGSRRAGESPSLGSAAGEPLVSRLAVDARTVLEALRDAPGSADELAARAGIETRVTAAALSALEVEGLAERGDGAVYRAVR